MGSGQISADGEMAATSSFRSIKDVITEMLAANAENISEKQRLAIEEFWEIVDAWSKDEVSLDEAARLTGDGWLRYHVLLHTPFDHPLRKEADRFLDGIIARSGGMQTNKGWFSDQDIDDQGGRFADRVDANSGEFMRVIQFPAGVDKNTGRTLWPVSEQSHAEERTYESPFKEDWY